MWTNDIGIEISEEIGRADVLEGTESEENSRVDIDRVQRLGNFRDLGNRALRCQRGWGGGMSFDVPG